MDNQQGPDSPQQPNRSQNRGLLTKVAVTALVAGLLGGGIAFGGATYVSNHTSTSTSVPAGSNSGGTTSTSKMSVKVDSQASKAFQAVKGSVVSVINMQRQSQSSSGLSGILGDMYGNSSSSSSNSKSSLETASEGSGVIYKKSGNAAYVVTNNHVVSGSNALEVILSNGKKLEASLVGKDAVTDLAVLKINGSDVNKVASFGNSDNIQVGESALAIGSPLGSQYATSLTEGIISAKKRSVPVTDESTNQQTGNATVIQTDAAINPGNSGGPLINLAGQVIGINSMKLASDNNGTSVEGMGFAIPSNEVVSIINQLIAKGKVVRPALGIKYVDLANISQSQQKSVLKLPTSVSSGVVVMANPSSGTPASAAGLKKYDVITSLGGKAISDDATLRDILYQHKIGDTVSITYYHNGAKKTTNVKLTETTSQLNQ
ncbi:S1C family serine protease [Secundilactobacillus kimchicus]|uniref:Trypsin-like serine protease n=1 Tax=Secundilactobacillus kimchicus JCM 15530 TaxID=1302272 RepID=A0A0R1HZT7_9LACO|nr:trypsin-like peptidase domain-containing protein [Secundilactobacillus kimchicus]KRK48503.1 trypsin-like serine protease [Secundilactobacillus kimchicus JCM 15530]MBT9671249.1 PDZ domain-containing protein [Secundilactobacillus kimchicus]